MSISAPNGWLVNSAMGFADELAEKTDDQIRTLARSLRLALAAGRQSPELLAQAVGLVVGVLRRRTKPIPPDAVAVEAALGVLTGSQHPLRGRLDRRFVLSLALYWHSLIGKSAHFIAWDDVHARDTYDYFEMLSAVIGCRTSLVDGSMTIQDRQSAYGVDVTFGSYSELAADYLRDNLHFATSDVVQKRLDAVIVDDLDGKLAEHVSGHVVVAGPRGERTAEAPGTMAVADRFRRRRDYRVDRDQSGIIFMKSAIPCLKSAVGWGAAPSHEILDNALRVEREIERREGFVSETQVLADISLGGYLREYDLLILSSRGLCRLDEVIIDKLSPWQRRDLALEQLTDVHRDAIYARRRRIREGLEVIPLLRALVPNAMDAVEEAIGKRISDLGASRMTEIARRVMLQVIDIQWREHLARLDFLRRQSNSLYEPASMIEERAADIGILYEESREVIRTDSIRYALTLGS